MTRIISKDTFYQRRDQWLKNTIGPGFYNPADTAEASACTQEEMLDEIHYMLRTLLERIPERLPDEMHPLPTPGCGAKLDNWSLRCGHTSYFEPTPKHCIGCGGSYRAIQE